MVEVTQNSFRKDFPALRHTVHGKPFVFLDSGASAQKPQSVIDAITRAYSEGYANVHRGLNIDLMVARFGLNHQK